MLIVLVFWIIIMIGGIGPIITDYKNSKNNVEISEEMLKLHRNQMPIWDDFDVDEYEYKYKYTDTY